MKDFDTIYNELKTKYSNIDTERKKNINTFIIFAVITIIFFILSFYISILMLLPAFLCIVIGVIVLSKSISRLKKSYKNTVISELVKNYDENLTFNADMTISRLLYNDAEFEPYDKFTANDYISGKIDGTISFEMGDVQTYVVSTDNDGNTTYSTIFRGLFSTAKLPQNINSRIKIHSDKGLLGKFIPNKELMHMDSQEFEKYFDIYTNDRILTMRILTSDIMDYLITFRQQNKIKFEFTLKNNYLYIRIHCSDMFETSIFSNIFNYNTLKKYYTFLDFICTLNKKIYYTLNEKNL